VVSQSERSARGAHEDWTCSSGMKPWRPEGVLAALRESGDTFMSPGAFIEDLLARGHGRDVAVDESTGLGCQYMHTPRTITVDNQRAGSPSRVQQHIHSPRVHSPHVHSPHVHSPHVHSPHVHSPHVHSLHVHTPHVHTSRVHSPGIHVHSPRSPTHLGTRTPAVSFGRDPNGVASTPPGVARGLQGTQNQNNTHAMDAAPHGVKFPVRYRNRMSIHERVLCGLSGSLGSPREQHVEETRHAMMETMWHSLDSTEGFIFGLKNKLISCRKGNRLVSPDEVVEAVSRSKVVRAAWKKDWQRRDHAKKQLEVCMYVCM
jgi:hypothetical protein